MREVCGPLCSGGEKSSLPPHGALRRALDGGSERTPRVLVSSPVMAPGGPLVGCWQPRARPHAWLGLRAGARGARLHSAAEKIFLPLRAATPNSKPAPSRGFRPANNASAVPQIKGGAGETANNASVPGHQNQAGSGRGLQTRKQRLFSRASKSRGTGTGGSEAQGREKSSSSANGGAHLAPRPVGRATMWSCARLPAADQGPARCRHGRGRWHRRGTVAGARQSPGVRPREPTKKIFLSPERNGPEPPALPGAHSE